MEVYATVCTVGRHGSRCAHFGKRMWAPIYVGAIYEARRRRRDGILTWRRVGSFGRPTSGEPSARFIAKLREESPYPWREPGTVRHGSVVGAL